MSSVTVARHRLTGYLMKGEAARFNDADYDQVLIHAMDMEASDVYFMTSRPVVAPVHGRLVRLTTTPLQHAEVVRLVVLMYWANAEVELRNGTPLDQAFSVKVNREKDYRFRWCATRVRIDGAFCISVIMRELKEVPPAAREEQYHADLCRAQFPLQGLVIITGETAAGKTTTLASWIRQIAEDRESDTHIVSIEAPMEYRLDCLATTSCQIDLSDVPSDVASFALGVVIALRRDPDGILVGESRDAESINAAVLAAQSGHLVLSTHHSNCVQTTYLRLIQGCPVDELYSIMGPVIGNIVIIVSQRLVRSTDRRRCAVRQHLVLNSYIRYELLQTAATIISLLPYRAAQLLGQFGQSMMQDAERLHAEGRIDQSQVDLFPAEGEAADATSQAPIGVLEVPHA
ncbi:ATPase, T2SS/T4P/T4SS family [Pseudomonas aeruginosa]|uniref:ATPase, T2SS/T4P/T4SS family n=1 Tax=Pseudomonas aeruginosa TaxID=287 RepID=UPI001E347329|nr:ATPase, T2SS/T4P/T4SS family [Pseudomonas aeruginosa]MCC9290085.1 Flp pilus assembly complex ATPase component TadA [Pseudomonas aeruginosa]UVN19087.1 putative DotB-like type IV secretion system protein [Pseudomonas aeruginosa]